MRLSSLLLIPALAVAVLLVPLNLVSAGGGSAPAPACHQVHGPFSVRKGYTVTAKGSRYIPYGTNLSGINASNPADNFAADAVASESQEDSAATFWCANTVRFGIDQDVLVAGGQANAAYLSAIEAVVAHGEHDGLAVVLDMSRGAKNTEPLPDSRTEAAWRVLAQRYRHDPQVIFDIYNEPRHVTWRQWRYGTSIGGHRFYGMEALARYLRSLGEHNLLWVEGNPTAQSLQEIPRYHLTGVGAVAYAFHHPTAPHTPRHWTRIFGKLAGRWPVVAGEWANYSRTDATWACWNDARTSVPAFLSYLAHRHIGMIAYDLAQPRLIESATLTDPTRIKKNWACQSGLNEGAGHRVLGWFRLHNG
jgi:Cellulase (glycosyl hydrolase family 5)